MQISPISHEMLAQANAATSAATSAASVTTSVTAGNPVDGFGSMITQGLQQVNQQLMTTQTDMQTLATGDVQNLHQIMIRMEDTRLSFQLMMQVRNRLLESYQDIMKMQV